MPSFFTGILRLYRKKERECVKWLKRILKIYCLNKKPRYINMHGDEVRQSRNRQARLITSTDFGRDFFMPLPRISR